MSKVGRHILDRIRKSLGRKTKLLPVPPYGSTSYWEGVYSKQQYDEVFEWADMSFADIQSFRYKMRPDFQKTISNIYSNSHSSGLVTQKDDHQTNVSSLNGDIHEALGIYQNHTFSNQSIANSTIVSHDKFHAQTNQNQSEEGNSNDESPSTSILILGCGNSQLGEHLLQYLLSINTTSSTNVNSNNFHKSDTLDDTFNTNNHPQVTSIPKIIQIDISSHLVSSMIERYQKYISSQQMNIVQDDATQLTLFENRSIDAIIDKGLIDAFYCANQKEQIQQVMKSVHRTLKPGKIFIFFSFSRPEFILQDTLFDDDDNKDDKTSTTYSLRNRTSTFSAINSTVVNHDRIPWSSVQVRELDNIFMYRFEKNANISQIKGIKHNTLSLKSVQKLALQRKQKSKHNPKK